MNLSDIKPHLIYAFSSDSELVKTIEEISKRFNIEREEIDRYVLSEKQVSAYTCFYGLTNLPKWDQVKQRLPLLELENKDIIDIGAGPGTFSLALLNSGFKGKLTLIESSELMRTQAKKLLSGLFERDDIQILGSAKEIEPKSKPRLGIFGHSANEMSLSQLNTYFKKLDLDEVLFIEPGTKEFFQKALKIRAALLERDYKVAYPCLGQGDCPLDPKKDWCHQFIKVSHDPEVERLCQLVKKDRRLLPLSIQYFSRESNQIDRDEHRVVRRHKPLKFAQPLEVCDSQNIISSIEVMHRGLAKKEVKNLENIKPGDIIKVEITKTLENGTKRVTWPK